MGSDRRRKVERDKVVDRYNRHLDLNNKIAAATVRLAAHRKELADDDLAGAALKSVKRAIRSELARIKRLQHQVDSKELLQ